MPTWDIIGRIALAILLGGLIGFERELRDQAAGLRTHMLVCVGSAAFTLVSVHGFDVFLTSSPDSPLRVDPSRVAAQIVSGIGFLGAGAIIRHGVTVRGLTTAASLWTVAAVGMAVGVGFHTLAVITTVAVVGSLSLFRLIEGRIVYPRARNVITVEVRFRGKDFGPLTRVVEVLDQEHVTIEHMHREPEAEASKMTLVLHLPRGMTQGQILQRLTQLEDVEEARVAEPRMPKVLFSRRN